MKWTLVNPAGTNDPDTDDIYSGLDGFGRVKDNRWLDGGGADLDRIQYGYDRAGNRIWRKNVVAAALGKEFDELYAYDGIHRLQDMARGTLNAGKTALTSETFAQCWTLDSTGNWNGFREDDNGDGAWDLIQSRAANRVNEITDISETSGPSWVTPAYSRAGNMTTLPQPADPTQSYTATYDAWDRLTKISDGSDTVAAYQYDGANRRIVQQSYTGGVLSETRHLYYTQPSQWQVLEERLGTSPDSADAERQFVWGLRYIDDCLLRDRDTDANGSLDERLYALQDANWNITAVVDDDEDVQERYAYAAYGMPVFLTAGFVVHASLLDWEYLYCGYRYEAATGLIHVRHRVYLPALGVWGQRDPLKQLSGSNLYQYAHSRPLVARDAYGLIADEVGFEQFLSLLDFWESLLYYGPATAHQLVCNSLSDLIRGFLDTNEERSAWDHFTAGGGTDRTLTHDQVLAALAQSPEFASAVADAAAACARDPNNSDTVTINFGTTAAPPFVASLGGLSVTFTYSCHGCCVAWLAQINDPYDFDPRGIPGFTDRSISGEGKTLGVRLAQLIGQCGWQTYNTSGTASGGSCPQQ